MVGATNMQVMVGRNGNEHRKAEFDQETSPKYMDARPHPKIGNK